MYSKPEGPAKAISKQCRIFILNLKGQLKLSVNNEVIRLEIYF